MSSIRVDELQVLVTANTKQLQKSFDQINGKMKDVEESTSRLSKGFQSGLTTAGKVAVASIVASVGLMGKSFIESASQLQSLRASFQSLTGSEKLTDQVMKSMYQFGLNTAFTNEQIQNAARSFLAIGTPVDQLGTMMQEVGDIAGATGADLGQLTLPLTQALARGKLQTQDFYQILNSGAGAFRITLQKVLDKHGLGGLQDALAKGTINADIMKEALADATKQGGFAFQGAIKQAQTFNGRMSNLKEAITNVGLSILGVDAATGKIDPSGPFAKLSQAVLVATNFLVAHGEVIKQVGAVIAILLVPAIISMGVQGLLAGARIGAGILLALGPIGLVIAAVVAAAALIVMNWDKIKAAAEAVWNWIKTNWPLLLAILTAPIGLAVLTIIKNWDTIKNAFSAAWNYIKSVWSAAAGFFSGVWNGITRALSSVKSWFGSMFSGAWNAVKSAFGGVSGFFNDVKNRIIGAFSGIGSSISSFFHNIWGSVGADLKSAINAVLHLPLTIPKISIPHVGTIGGQTLIPRLAKGGIIDSATLALVGESGKEAVMPLENNTGWIDELAGKLNAQGGGQHLTIKIGEDTILDKMIDGINGRSFLNGTSVLQV